MGLQAVEGGSDAYAVATNSTGRREKVKLSDGRFNSVYRYRQMSRPHTVRGWYRYGAGPRG
jgi:hypothetical protein